MKKSFIFKIDEDDIEINYIRGTRSLAFKNLRTNKKDVTSLDFVLNYAPKNKIPIEVQLYPDLIDVTDVLVEFFEKYPEWLV